MPSPARLSIANRFLAATLILYGVLLLGVSLHVFYTAVRQGSPLNFSIGLVQTLTLLFVPVLILGLWRPRAASALLSVAAAAILALTLTATHAAASTTAGMVGASLILLGVPMLGAAIFFHLTSGTTRA